MPKNSNNEIHRILRDISNLMQHGKSSSDIMTLLHIPLRSYRRYTSKIYKQQSKEWHDLVKHEVATQLLRLRSSYEETHLAAKELCKTPGLQTTDVLLALAAKDQALLDQLKLMLKALNY